MHLDIIPFGHRLQPSTKNFNTICATYAYKRVLYSLGWNIFSFCYFRCCTHSSIVRIYIFFLSIDIMSANHHTYDPLCCLSHVHLCLVFFHFCRMDSDESCLHFYLLLTWFTAALFCLSYSSLFRLALFVWLFYVVVFTVAAALTVGSK